jgi:hypothetical protein
MDPKPTFGPSESGSYVWSIAPYFCFWVLSGEER